MFQEGLGVDFKLIWEPWKSFGERFFTEKLIFLLVLFLVSFGHHFFIDFSLNVVKRTTLQSTSVDLSRLQSTGFSSFQ